MGHNHSKHGRRQNKPGQVQGGKDVLGGGSRPNNVADSQGKAEDPRAAAAEAAERRLKAQQQRGTNASNPKQGQLAAQAARNNTKAATLPSPSQKDERLVWD